MEGPGSDLQSPCSRRDGLDGFTGENRGRVSGRNPSQELFLHLLDLHLCLDIKRPPKPPRMTHWKEILLELYSLTPKSSVSGNGPTNRTAIATVQSEALSALARSLPLYPQKG